MIIVSQDKMEITESSELKIDCVTRVGGEFPIENIEIIGYYIMNKKDNTVLGKYSTEERAKEVLQEIVSKYSSYLELKGGPAIMQGGMDVQPNIFNVPKVYCMPEE